MRAAVLNGGISTYELHAYFNPWVSFNGSGIYIYCKDFVDLLLSRRVPSLNWLLVPGLKCQALPA